MSPKGIYPRKPGSSYNAKHYRVKLARGEARLHKCACGAQAAEWATIHGRDGMDPMDYEAMCRSCHGKYDRTPEHIEAMRQANIGRKRPDLVRRNKARTGWHHRAEVKERIAEGVRRYRNKSAGE